MSFEFWKDRLFKGAESTEEPNQIPSPQNPVKAAVEQVMINKMDKENATQDGIHPETVVVREPTMVKESTADFWEKVATCAAHIKTKRGKYKTPVQFRPKGK
jgi:hypothetical protein